MRRVCLCVTCNGTFMWGHIILLPVSCSSCHGICVEMSVLTMGADMFDPLRHVAEDFLYSSVFLVYKGTICSCLVHVIMCSEALM